MEHDIDYTKMDEIENITVLKAEEFLYNSTQTSSAKQVDEIVKRVAKLYDI